MAFQIKDFVSITASMLNWMKASTDKISDYNVGSVARTLVEAPAAEIDELYQQMFIGLKEAIPVATYNSFNFGLLPSVSATGLIRVTVAPSADPAVIQAGSTFSAPGLLSTYSAIQDTAIPANASFVDVTVKADVTGAAGNIAVGQSFSINPEPSGFVSATNLSAFSSGQDAETEDERKIRFAAYIDSISRATNSALRYGLKTATLTDASGNVTERVATAVTVEPYLTDSTKPIAMVECYIHNGVGGTSAALVAQAQKIVNGYYDESGEAVPGYKASGIPTTVYAAQEVLVAVSGAITALDGYDHDSLVTSATSAVYTYLQGLEIGKPALTDEIIHVVKSVDGVYKFALTLPSVDAAVTGKQKIMPGSVVLS